MSYTPSPEEREEHARSLEELLRLLAIMQRLRAPGGCPWDREQTLESLRPYLLEETYEVLEAIDRGDDEGHREELGDLLLQIVFHAELAREDRRWSMAEVAHDISEKLWMRHPHVFGDADASDASTAYENWERVKAQEKEARGRARKSVLDGVPRAAPALMRAERLQDKAASVGFDWDAVEGVREKVDEELGELDEAVASGEPDAIAHEVGDLLFAVVNLARWLGVHPEDALRECIDRFGGRFRVVERGLAADGLEARDAGIEELERRWQRAKREVG